MKNLVGRKAMIINENDNENYDAYRNKVLIITSAAIGGLGYDNSMLGEDEEDSQHLCCFECEDGSDFPFSLYEYEFELI